MLDDADSTVMSILHGVAGGQGSRRQLSLERFCVTYTQPLVNYLIRAKGLAENDAIDLVHDFWIGKMLQPTPDVNLVAKYLVAQQSRDKSSFRSYLSAALTNFVRSRYRSATETLRRSQVSVEQLEGWEAESPEDLDQFDVAWANHILVMVLNSVRSECESSRLQIKWIVFTRLILQPIASNQTRPSYAALAAELGLQNTKKIATSLTTFKRIFLRHLQIAVQDYLPANSSEESLTAAQDEVAAILMKLSRAGGLQLPLAEWGVATLQPRSDYSLVLNNLTPANLIQSDQDYKTAWDCLLTTNLSEALDFQSCDSKPPNVADIIANEVRDLKVLDQIRSGAKRLGSRSAGDDENGSHLNPKLYGLIYLVAIAAAKLNLNKNISTQPIHQLASLSKSYANENWVDPKTKLFLQRYHSELSGDCKSSPNA